MTENAINLDNLKVGDTVVTRDGTPREVTGILQTAVCRFPYKISMTPLHVESVDYTAGGRYWSEADETHYLDIVEIISSKGSGGLKFDGGKLLFRPLMRGLALPLRAVAAVLSYGAQKYKEDSWQTVPDAKRRYEDAYYRHMNAREAGEIYDPESGLPHRAHELCNLMFLLWFDITDGTVQNITEFKEPPTK